MPTNATDLKLKQRKIIVTAGPTREPIDPVRYLSNRSSGKMGYALAAAAVAAGAEVVLISGPTNLSSHHRVKKIEVITAAEMLSAVMAEISDCDIFIAAAAVCDYRPEKIAQQKIKKNDAELTLTLVKNPDIVAAVAALPHKPLVVGFAAETENLVTNSLKKLHAKNLDLIVANQVGTNRGFDSDENELLVLGRKLQPLRLKQNSKIVLAQQLIAFIAWYSAN